MRHDDTFGITIHASIVTLRPGAHHTPCRLDRSYTTGIVQHYVETRMNRRIFALALAATAFACKEQPRRNADGSPALSYAAQDSLLKAKDSVIADKTRQLSEQSSIIGDAATSARLISEIDKDLANVRLKTGKKPTVTNVAETEANASSK